MIAPITGIPRPRPPAWLLPLTMAALTLCLFGDTLVIPGRVPANVVSDLREEYLYWRQFAFNQIRHGHFPLWNPNSFSGTPFFGDPQSAMLYPPNWLYLLFSPDRATSWLVAIHFFLAGCFAGLFARRRGCGALATIIAAIVYSCAGPVMTNLRPGHLPLLFSAAWTPLLFCSIESILAGRQLLRPALAGMAAVALLALDGYPQFAFYSAFAAAIYTLIRLPHAAGKWRPILTIAAIFTVGWALAAAQIAVSIQAAGESIRAGGLSFPAASAFSLPPENLLTAIVPGLFGDAAHFFYYGRWYWWETCIFIGPAALLLAILGAPRAGKPLAIMAALTLLLALGDNTPLYYFLYDFFPGFSSFRAPARFDLLTLLFVSALVALGIERIPAFSRRAQIKITVATAMTAFLLAVACLWAWNSQSDPPGDFDRIISAMKETHAPIDRLPLLEPDFAYNASIFAAQQFAIAAAVALIIAAILFFFPLKRATLLIAFVAASHLILFAVGQRVGSDRQIPMPASWAADIASLPAGSRILLCNARLAESGIDNNFQNVGGSNPLILARTARLLAAIQDEPPDEIGLNYPIRTISPLYRMLRCARIFPGHLGGDSYPINDPLPRLLLVDHFTQAINADAALAAVLDPTFDPAAGVVLESAPAPAPAPEHAASPGKVRLVSETTDALEIEADLPAPQILLITDAYSQAWQITPLENEPATLHILPADYCLRAVPLTAGHHHFKLEYRPAGLQAGIWISLVSLAAYLAAAIYAICFRRFARPAR